MTTTFQKSKELKEAGFPQPEPQAGQVWYEKSGFKYIITGVSESGERIEGRYFKNGPEMSRQFDISRTEFYDSEDIFAPKATDILALLPGKPLVRIENGNGVFWAILDRNGDYLRVNEDNPAEAAAADYLAYNKKDV